MNGLGNVACILCLLASAAAAPAEERRPAEVAPSPSPVAAAIQSRLAAGGTSGGEPLVARDALRSFYAERGHLPAWVVNGILPSHVEDLAAALRVADREGLRPGDYHLEAIEALIAGLRPGAAAPEPADPLAAAGRTADLELLLTDAFFLYASDLTAGRVNPESVEPEWNIAGRARNLGFLLDTALERGHLGATLRDLPPAREDYRLLREALAAQRAIAASGGWPLVPWGPPLREGDRGPRVVSLRRRLIATGELSAATDPGGELFDATLAAALRRFQERHGLDPDAIAGRRTLSELNTPAALRARQIEANLERLRWLPRELGPRRLLVNIADFRLELTEAGAPTLAMRVIASRQARRTPFFAGEITSILLNPPWTVPLKLAVEDKLPLILEDPGFLEEQGFRVFAPSGQGWTEVDPAGIDWTKLSANRFPYRLRQDPGPKNALGRVKFQVPNRHDIYLHDTPSRGLFARAERTFSSGCVRVERAVDLAARLLAADPAWTRTRIEETIAALETVSVPLPEPMPVFLLYWTAWVDRDGTLQFREDVYGRDAALLDALAAGRR